MPSAESVHAFELSDLSRSRAILRDGTSMPALGLGVYQTPPGEVTQTAVREALAMGYRLIDTAALYRNEADVGAAIAAAGIDRKSLYVTTKLWNDDQGHDRALRAFDESLKRLGLEYVDLYLIHWPVTGKRLDSWRALERIARDGRCRSIGVSNFTVAHLEELFAASSTVPAVNQVEFNPFLYQRELLELCNARGVQLEAYAPLTRGRRLDHPTLVRIASDHRATPAQVLLRWGLQHGIVVIPKSVHAERMRENLGAFELSLSAAEMETLDGLDASFRVSWDPAQMA